jgi:hypothetical protein
VTKQKLRQEKEQDVVRMKLLESVRKKLHRVLHHTLCRIARVDRSDHGEFDERFSV